MQRRKLPVTVLRPFHGGDEADLLIKADRIGRHLRDFGKFTGRIPLCFINLGLPFDLRRYIFQHIPDPASEYGTYPGKNVKIRPCNFACDILLQLLLLEMRRLRKTPAVEAPAPHDSLQGNLEITPFSVQCRPS